MLGEVRSSGQAMIIFGVRDMQIDQASKILAEMYADGARSSERSVMVHLFAVKYADQIREMRPKDIVDGAGLPKSYHTEIRKGINLAKYVEVKG